MKAKVLFMALASLFTAGAMAQDCTFFFPQTKGTQLVRRGYDANKNLQNVMVYEVVDVQNTPSGELVTANYKYTDKSGKVVTTGSMQASCENGEFFMDMKEVASFPTAVSMMNTDVVVVGDFMNYPNTFSSDFEETEDSFDNATINVYKKGNRKDRANISVSDREYVTNEQVETPAGTFDCAKVRYNIDIRSPKETISGYGYEWYAPNIGIVRSEQYGKNNVLQSYTVLEEVKE